MAKLTKKQKRRIRRRKKIIRTVFRITVGLLMAFILWLLLRNTLPALRPEPTPTPTPSPSPTPTPVPTPTPTPSPSPTPTPTPSPSPTPEPVSITLTAVGDCTLGGDMNGMSEGRFRSFVSKEDGSVDYDYCFRNVKSIFERDDFTLVNLEVVLTDSSNYLLREDKVYIMRGQPDYVNMLTGSSVEVCNIANNHMTDFGDWGIEQTAALLEENNLGYCGYGYTYLTELDGIRVGFVGINYWTTKKENFEAQLRDMREQCDLMIVSIHWGYELSYAPIDYQIDWGHLAVDLGADLVVGHHPHVIEGIENYKGVNILYSLGNFCFGGKANPTDKNTFIYQTTFTLSCDGTKTEDFTVIPCKITSVADDSSNNYQPTPIEDEAAQQEFFKTLDSYSALLSHPVLLAQ